MAEAKTPAPSSSSAESKTPEAPLIIPAVGAPMKLSGLTILSALTGIATLIACIVLAVGLLNGMDSSTIMGIAIAAGVLALITLVCGGLAIDKAHGTPITSRERMIMVSGITLVALGAVVAIYVPCIQMATAEQPHSPLQPGQKLPMNLPVLSVPAVELPPAAAPAPAPAAKAPGAEGAAGGAEKPAGGAEKPAGGADAPVGGAEKPAGGADAPAGGAEKPAGGADAPAGGAEKPAGGV
jgi:hypothetical protein